MINGHGDDAYKYAKDVLYNFSSNVYYKGCDLGLLEEVRKSVFKIQNYPSPVANELSAAAADKYKMQQDQFLFGNGATELFYLLAQLYRGKTATIVGPTFSEYEDACKMYDVSVEFVPWEKVEEGCFKTDLVFICNPNNPTGDYIDLFTLEGLIRQSPGSLFVIDEAYVEFTTKECSAMELINRHKNIIIVKSLTKTFAVPGIRLGYLVSNESLVSQLLALKLPWTVNSLAISAGLYIFKNYEQLMFSNTDLIGETSRFQKELDTITGLEVMPSVTSYFLVNVKKGTAADLKEYLMNKHQVLVRDATNFTTLKGEFIRLAVQEKQVNKVLINALQQWSLI